MTIQAVGFTLDLIGKILIAISVLIVHSKIGKGNKNNEKTMVILERELAIIGIALMFIGYILQLESKLYF